MHLAAPRVPRVRSFSKIRATYRDAPFSNAL
jgi:hypothetical protein